MKNERLLELYPLGTAILGIGSGYLYLPHLIQGKNDQLVESIPLLYPNFPITDLSPILSIGIFPLLAIALMFVWRLFNKISRSFTDRISYRIDYTLRITVPVLSLLFLWFQFHSTYVKLDWQFLWTRGITLVLACGLFYLAGFCSYWIKSARLPPVIANQNELKKRYYTIGGILMALNGLILLIGGAVEPIEVLMISIVPFLLSSYFWMLYLPKKLREELQTY